MLRLTARLLSALLLVGCAEPPAPPAPALDVAVDYDEAGDWPHAARDLAATRHSPLKQIDARNVTELRPIWAYALSSAFSGAERGVAAADLTPIVIGGVLYATAADRVVALRAHSGVELWRHTIERDAPSQHGVAHWRGTTNAPRRIFFTAGRRLIALDAATGKRVMAFGADGEIELPAGASAAPTVFEDLVLVPAGGVHAYDALTGASIWSFADAEAAAATATPVASALTVDVDRGLVFAALAVRDTDEHYGGNRAGERGLDNALVALDVRSGERRWQFQTVRHDLWGYDLSTAPALVDATIGGRRLAAVAQPAPTGYLYVLDRSSGEPLFGVAETPMRESAVPGEHSASAQPLPVKPPPLARVSFVRSDLVGAADTTELHARRCRELVERSGGADNFGPFTPYAFRAPGAAPRSTVVFPGANARRRGGVAADPLAGLVFVNTTSTGDIGWIEANDADSTAAQAFDLPRQRVPYRRMSAAGNAARFAASYADDAAGVATAPMWPCQKPPWGELVAVSVATGDVVWRTRLGITPELPAEKQRTGRPNRGAPITTGSGLVLIGASDDRRLRAFDSRSGAELWSTELPRSLHGAPITYLGEDGKQYFAVAAAGGESVDDPVSAEGGVLIGYGLP